MSNLLLMPGANGNRSASQRRELLLQAMNEHLMQVIAVLTTQQGGLALVPGEALKKGYDVTTTRDPLTGNIVYMAKVAEGETKLPLPLAPSLNDEAAALDGAKDELT